MLELAAEHFGGRSNLAAAVTRRCYVSESNEMEPNTTPTENQPDQQPESEGQPAPRVPAACGPVLADLARLVANNEKDLLSLSRQQPRLVVLLRHSGCVFCREALSDLKAQRPQIEAAGLGIVLVHQTSDEEAAELFAQYGLDDVPRIADPHLLAYRIFELKRERMLRLLLHPKVWARGFKAALIDRHGFGRPRGDVRQMPGVFVVSNGRVLSEFRHHLASDRPHYATLATASQCSTERCGF
jgi:peroxiredoxin